MKRRAFLISAAAAAAACSRRPRLNVYNWSDYVAPETIPNFERESGIEVRYGTYENNQEMLAQVMSGNSGWDVVFPSNDFIQPMRQMNLLAPLRAELLPNLDNLDAAFRRPPWDPELQYSVPYMWGFHRHRVSTRPAGYSMARSCGTRDSPARSPCSTM